MGTNPIGINLGPKLGVMDLTHVPKAGFRVENFDQRRMSVEVESAGVSVAKSSGGVRPTFDLVPKPGNEHSKIPTFGDGGFNFGIAEGHDFFVSAGSPIVVAGGGRAVILRKSMFAESKTIPINEYGRYGGEFYEYEAHLGNHRVYVSELMRGCPIGKNGNTDPRMAVSPFVTITNTATGESVRLDEEFSVTAEVLRALEASLQEDVKGDSRVADAYRQEVKTIKQQRVERLHSAIFNALLDNELYDPEAVKTTHARLRFEDGETLLITINDGMQGPSAVVRRYNGAGEYTAFSQVELDNTKSFETVNRTIKFHVVGNGDSFVVDPETGKVLVYSRVGHEGGNRLASNTMLSHDLAVALGIV